MYVCMIRLILPFFPTRIRDSRAKKASSIDRAQDIIMAVLKETDLALQWLSIHQPDQATYSHTLTGE